QSWADSLAPIGFTRPAVVPPSLSIRPSDPDCSIKECVDAFIVPIGSHCRFKTSERAPVRPWHARRIEEHDLCAADRVSQRAEQRQVILASEEHDLVFRVV